MTTKVKWLGHACFLVSDSKHNIIIDPYLTDNPQAVLNLEQLENINAIIVTHGHQDHLGDAIELAKRDDALIISTVEVVRYCQKFGVSKVHGLQPGGEFNFDFGNVKLTLAYHGSSLPDGSYGGISAGVLLTISEKTIYHAGDTALFGDMKLIGQEGIDLALLPIGDNYTMGPKDAAKAAELLNAKLYVPMHYNTWEIIEQDPRDFQILLPTSLQNKVKLIQPGETINL